MFWRDPQGAPTADDLNLAWAYAVCASCHSFNSDIYRACDGAVRVFSPVSTYVFIGMGCSGPA